MKFIRILHADWMKTKHTAIRLIAYITPIAYSIIMIMYNKHNKLQIQNYATFFNAMAIILPLGIALISTLICQQEENAGSFNGLLSIPASRASIYMSKLIMLISIIAIDILVSTIIMILGSKFILQLEFNNYSLFILGALLMIFGSIVICSFDLLISLRFGMGASIGIGSLGVLIVAIVGLTPVGDSFWQFVLWTFQARLSELPGLFMPGANIPINTLPSQYFYEQIERGTWSVIIFFILITILGVIWFGRWEGKKTYE